MQISCSSDGVLKLNLKNSVTCMHATAACDTPAPYITWSFERLFCDDAHLPCHASFFRPRPNRHGQLRLQSIRCFGDFSVHSLAPHRLSQPDSKHTRCLSADAPASSEGQRCREPPRRRCGMERRPCRLAEREGDCMGGMR